MPHLCVLPSALVAAVLSEETADTHFGQVFKPTPFRCTTRRLVLAKRHRFSSLTLFALLAFLRADGAADPVAVFKTGDYYHAIPALQEAVAKNPRDAVLQDRKSVV